MPGAAAVVTGRTIKRRRLPMDLHKRLDFDPARLRVVRCESRASSKWDRQALATVYEAMYAERWRPADSTTAAVEFERLRTQTFPEHSAFWIGLLDDRHVVGAAMSAPIPSADPPRASVVLYVAPIARGRGLGSRLMTAVLEHGDALGHAVYEAVSSTRAPEGGAWATRLGARVDFEGCTQELLVEGLDIPRLEAWARRVGDAGPQLTTTPGRYSESEIRAIAGLMAGLRLVAKRGHENQPLDAAVASLRKYEDTLDSLGVERWTSTARDRATGEILGFSVAFYNPQIPRVLEHMATAVVPHAADRALDGLLKVELILTAVRENPSIHFIRTTDPATATAALDANHAIGYREHHRYTRWQIDAASLAQRLQSLSAGREIPR